VLLKKKARASLSSDRSRSLLFTLLRIGPFLGACQVTSVS
jgi:hypothetical protein